MQRNDIGTAVFGGAIALVGVLLLLDRSGTFAWSTRWSIWPLLLVGYGLSRMVQSRFDAPRGLFPMALGLWLFGGQAGWFSLRDTWPLLIVALGLGIAWSSYVGAEPRVPVDAPPSLGGMSRTDYRRLRRRHRGPFLPLAVIILIVIAARVDTERAFGRGGSADTTHAYAILGATRRVANADVVNGGQLVSVMGLSDLDLRHASLPATGEASIEITTVMGGAIVRVPPDWVVDVQAVPVLGTIVDRRPPRSESGAATASNAPSRLVVRGNIVMGNLVIKSEDGDD